MSEIIILGANRTGNWFREHLSPGGLTRWLGEGLVSDYKAKMEVLREVDEKIATWTGQLEGLVHKAKSAVKGRRILDAAILLGEINQKLQLISGEGRKVREIQEEALREYEAEHELEIPEHMLPKEAGVMDYFKRRWIGNKLQSELTAKNIKLLEALLVTAEKVVHAVKSHLKKLGRARDTGRIGEYLDVLSTIGTEQIKFTTEFSKVYNTYFKTLVQAAVAKKKQQEKELADYMGQVPATENMPIPETERAAPIEMPSEEGDLEVPALEIPALPPIPSTNPAGDTMRSPIAKTVPPAKLESKKDEVVPLPIPHTKPSPLPPKEEWEEKAYPTKMSPVLMKGVKEPVTAMMKNEFVQELLKMGDDKYLMAAAMAKFSEQLEEWDEEASLELLRMAQKVIE